MESYNIILSMSYNDAKYIPLQDKQGSVFQWWLVDNSEPNMIPTKCSPFGRNFRVNGQGISIRPWFLQRALLSNTVYDYPKGIAAYLRSNPTNDSIIVNFPYSGTQKLVSINPTTYAVTPITTGANIASSARMRFQSANDSLYCMNWVDYYGKLNGTTYTVPSTWISNFAPSFSAWFDNSMWVSGWSTNPNRLYKSSENNPDSYSGSWADIFDAPYPVVWIAASGQTLYIFTENTIDMINNNSIKQIGSSLVYTSVPLEATEWAVNHDSIISIGKDCLYLSKSNKIRRIVPQGMLHYDIQEISHRKYEWISNTMAKLDPDQTQSFAYHIPEKQIVKWHCKSTWSNFNDICLVYNYEYDEWMVDSNKVFNWGIWYRTKAFTISQVEAKLYEDEFWTTDDWTPIQFEYWTKRFDFWEPTINKELWETRTFVKINSLTTLTQSIIADWNQVDTYDITETDIANLVDGIGTEPVWTYMIGEDWIPAENLYNLEIVREKWDLQIRAKYFLFGYLCWTLGAEILLQRLTPRVQMLSPLTTSTS